MSDGAQWESFKVEGGQLLDQFKKLIHEGNVRRIVIKRDGESIVEFPLTVGLVGAALLPALAAVGAIAALVAECTIEAERDKPAEEWPANHAEPTADARGNGSNPPRQSTAELGR